MFILLIRKLRIVNTILSLFIPFIFTACLDGEVCTTTDPNGNCLLDDVTIPVSLVGVYDFLYLQLQYNNGTNETHDTSEYKIVFTIQSDAKFNMATTTSSGTQTINGSITGLTSIGTNKWNIMTSFNGKTDDEEAELRNDTLIIKAVADASADPDGIGFVEYDYYLKR